MQVKVRRFLLERDHEYSVHLCFALKDWPQLHPALFWPQKWSHMHKEIVQLQIFYFTV